MLKMTYVEVMVQIDRNRAMKFLLSMSMQNFHCFHIRGASLLKIHTESEAGVWGSKPLRR